MLNIARDMGVSCFDGAWSQKRYAFYESPPCDQNMTKVGEQRHVVSSTKSQYQEFDNTISCMRRSDTYKSIFSILPRNQVLAVNKQPHSHIFLLCFNPNIQPYERFPNSSLTNFMLEAACVMQFATKLGLFPICRITKAQQLRIMGFLVGIVQLICTQKRKSALAWGVFKASSVPLPCILDPGVFGVPKRYLWINRLLTEYCKFVECKTMSFGRSFYLEV